MLAKEQASMNLDNEKPGKHCFIAAQILRFFRCGTPIVQMQIVDIANVFWVGGITQYC